MKDFNFSSKDIKAISKALGVDLITRAENYRFVLENKPENRRLSLEIYPNIPIGENLGNLIQVYTMNSYMQLHYCSGYIASNSLGEVIFISDNQGRISGLIVEKGAGCSFYANLDSSILSGDFTRLAPEVMQSSIALSLAEHLIPDSE